MTEATEPEASETELSVDYNVVSQHLASQLGEQGVRIAMQQALIEKLRDENQQLRQAVSRLTDQVSDQDSKERKAK